MDKKPIALVYGKHTSMWAVRWYSIIYNGWVPWLIHCRVSVRLPFTLRPNFFTVLQLHRAIILPNAAADKYFPYRKADLVSKNFSELLPYVRWCMKSVHNLHVKACYVCRHNRLFSGSISTIYEYSLLGDVF